MKPNHQEALFVLSVGILIVCVGMMAGHFAVELIATAY